MERTSINLDWQQQALCRKNLKKDKQQGKFVNFSFLDFYLEDGKRITEEVKQLCESCPVKNECLEHALAHEKFGYWGGTSEKQRKKIRNERKIICHVPDSNTWIDVVN